MAVTLDGNTLTNIIDTLFSESSKISEPNWINQNPELQTTVWSKKPLKVTYVLMATDDLKWEIDQIVVGASAVTLVDTIYSINDNYWLSSVSAKWAGDKNWEYSWRIEIELIKT